jgi:hypothetical protein
VALRHQIALALPFRRFLCLLTADLLLTAGLKKSLLFYHKNWKSTHHIAEVRAFLNPFFRVGRNALHPLRQPGYPKLRTRGFASPDFSGFARSVIIASRVVILQLTSCINKSQEK